MVKPPLFPIREGTTSRQAHTNLPKGSVEVERGRKGFFGRVSHLYKTNAPTAWTRIEGDLRPQSFDLNKVVVKDLEDPNETFTEVLYNNDIRVSISRRKEAMPSWWEGSGI